MSYRLKATRCPTDELSLTNKAIVNINDFPDEIKYADISTGPGQHLIFSVEKSSEEPPGHMGFSMVQRKWAAISVNQEIEVTPYLFDNNAEVVCTVVLETDFLQKKMNAEFMGGSQQPFDTDQMARELLLQFSGLALTVGQTLVFNFQEKLLGLAVKALEAANTSTVPFGRLVDDTVVQFVKAENSSLALIGGSLRDV